MTIKKRIAQLEASRVDRDEVTLSELVEYSLANKPDPDFERRFARSTLGQLIADVVRKSH